MARMPVPRICKSCKHRVKTEEGGSVFVGIVDHECKKFLIGNGRDAPRRLSCYEALYNKCRTLKYEPTLMTRFWKWLEKL